MNILVTGSGSLLGQGIIKSLELSKLKYKLFTTDYFSSAVGLYWAKKSFLLPDILNPLVTEKDWLEEIIGILYKEKIDILIPGLDFEIPIFSKNKKIIEERTSSTVIVSTKNVVDIGKDKWKTFQFLKENGFYYPNSSLPKGLENSELKNKYPLIVKPRFGNTSKDVFIVENAEELAESVEKVDNPIIQEYIGSEESEFTCSTTYVDKNIVSCITLRRTLKNGNTNLAFLEDYTPIDLYIKKLTEALKPFGPTNFQLRLCSDRPTVFEINPRFSGTTPIRALFGVNEVEATLNAILFNKFDNKFTPKPGVIIRYWENQFVDWNTFKSFSK